MEQIEVKVLGDFAFEVALMEQKLTQEGDSPIIILCTTLILSGIILSMI